MKHDSGHAGTVDRVGADSSGLPLFTLKTGDVVPANVSTGIRQASFRRHAAQLKADKLSKKPHAEYMREWRKKGRTAAQRAAWEEDHAFPIPVPTMFDLLRQAALYQTF